MLPYTHLTHSFTTEAQHLATYKVTVRYMFENPTTLQHQSNVLIYNPELLHKINTHKVYRLPPPAASAAPLAPASRVPPPTVNIDWVWEETTHKHYSPGQHVEITREFKPKYSNFVGRTAVVRKVFAKHADGYRYKDHIFFLEVTGKDADETAKLRQSIKDRNHKCFTEFLCGEDRFLLPCRPTHMRFFLPKRHEMAAAAAAKVAADQAASKAAADAADRADSKRPRDENDQGPADSKRPRESKPASLLDNLLDLATIERNRIAQETREIAVGDNVEITKIYFKGWYPESFIGFQGVVQSIRKGVFQTTCFVKLTRNQNGEPVTPDQTRTIEEWNKAMYGPGERSFMKCNIDYLVLADPNVPSQHKTQHDPRSKLDRPRHSKYDPTASPPWSGGDVRPFLYGRKVTFILQGRRGEPITR
jgi:hypothetical protein